MPAANLAHPAAKPRILCVDDEPLVLQGLRDALRRGFDVEVAESGDEALARLRADRRGFAVIVSDMRMPAMSGAAFLQAARGLAPLTVRMLLTGHADTDAAIQAVNDGQIFRFLTKPCDPHELRRACDAATWQHQLLVTERRMLEQTLRGCIQALTDVLALASPAAFGHAGRITHAAGRLAEACGWDDAWEIEVAAMLAQVGAITLPDATAEKLACGEPLSCAEQAMVDRVPARTEQILGHIPRIEGVMQIIQSCHRRFDSVAADGTLAVGARILRIAIDFARQDAAGRSAGATIEAMRGSPGLYDPELLETFADVCAGSDSDTPLELPLPELRPGMRLAGELRAAPGHLLVTRGSVVTPELLERLSNFPSGSIREPIRAFAA
jgi:response regulator RpfG family c-di-GMP phosphodiesterase